MGCKPLSAVSYQLHLSFWYVAFFFNYSVSRLFALFFVFVSNPAMQTGWLWVLVPGFLISLDEQLKVFGGDRLT